MAVWVCTVSIRRQTRPDYVGSPLEQSPHVTGTRYLVTSPFLLGKVIEPRARLVGREFSARTVDSVVLPGPTSVACSVVAFASRLSVRGVSLSARVAWRAVRRGAALRFASSRSAACCKNTSSEYFSFAQVRS